MSRTLTTAMSNALVADTVRPIYLVNMEFDSSENPDDLNFWSGVGDLTYGGETYLGVGDLLAISQIQETSDISASGMNVSITGVKSEFLVIAKDHEYQGRPITVRLGAFNESGSLVSDPIIVFSGFMDTMTIAENGEYSTIMIAAENKLVAFEKTKVRRYTAEDQKIDYPLKLANGNDNPNYDAGFEFVTAIVEKQIMWGRPTGSSQNGSTGSSGNRGGAGNNGSWTDA